MAYQGIRHGPTVIHNTPPGQRLQMGMLINYSASLPSPNPGYSVVTMDDVDDYVDFIAKEGLQRTNLYSFSSNDVRTFVALDQALLRHYKETYVEQHQRDNPSPLTTKRIERNRLSVGFFPVQGETGMPCAGKIDGWTTGFVAHRDTLMKMDDSTDLTIFICSYMPELSDGSPLVTLN